MLRWPVKMAQADTLTATEALIEPTIYHASPSNHYKGNTKATTQRHPICRSLNILWTKVDESPSTSKSTHTKRKGKKST